MRTLEVFNSSALFLSIMLFHLRPMRAFSANITIDDTFGDQLSGIRPVYSPSTAGVWNNVNCSDCAVVPDVHQAFHGSWTSATYNPSLGPMSVDLQFKGTAIYVYFILANILTDNITTLTQCTFTLDGKIVGTFQHVPTLSTQFLYNALVYSNASLLNTDHQFSIGTSGLNYSVLVIFDYAIYTFDDALPTNSTSTSALTSPAAQNDDPEDADPGEVTPGSPSMGVSTGAIAGGVFGGLVLLAFFVVLLLCIRRRQPPGALILGRGDSIDQPPQNQTAAQDTSQARHFASRTSLELYRPRPAPLNDTYAISPSYSEPWHSDHFDYDFPQDYIFDERSSYDRESSHNSISKSSNSYSAPPTTFRRSKGAAQDARTFLSALPNGEVTACASSVEARDVPIPSSGVLGAGFALPTLSPPRAKGRTRQVDALSLQQA